MMQTATMSRQLPRNLRGYAVWLQIRHAGEWMEVCSLRPADARAICRWLDWHQTNTSLRVIYTRV